MNLDILWSFTKIILKKRFHFQWTIPQYNDTTLKLYHYDLGRTSYKIIIAEKIKTIDNEIEQSKSRQYLDSQTTKISFLSSGNVGKYVLLTGKYVLSENS